MNRRKILITILVIITIGAIIIVPYLPLYFGELGTNIIAHDIENAFGDLEFDQPVDIQGVLVNDTTDSKYRIFVVQQNGIIYEIQNYIDKPEKSVFLNLQNVVSDGGEQGLLGISFHPEFNMNGYLFVDYTSSSPLQTEIVRFTVPDPFNGVVDQETKKDILQVSQPYGNHNAGQIIFGLDGFFYITLGDGGSANDPSENAQNRRNLLGSILRIDVDVDDDLPYRIPSSNPFANNENGYREEIFAYGFRNPWRMSQDSVTGYIYVGDVGQNNLEEINVIDPSESGKNYGWDRKEGTNCFLSFSCDGDFIDPIAQYDHSEGISVTGGYVYRGSNLDDLHGFLFIW